MKSILFVLFVGLAWAAPIPELSDPPAVPADDVCKEHGCRALVEANPGAFAREVTVQIDRQKSGTCYCNKASNECEEEVSCDVKLTVTVTALAGPIYLMTQQIPGRGGDLRALQVGQTRTFTLHVQKCGLAKFLNLFRAGTMVDFSVQCPACGWLSPC